MLSLVGSQEGAVRFHVPGPAWVVVFSVTWGFERGRGAKAPERKTMGGSSGGLTAAHWAFFT